MHHASNTGICLPGYFLLVVITRDLYESRYLYTVNNATKLVVFYICKHSVTIQKKSDLLYSDVGYIILLSPLTPRSISIGFQSLLELNKKYFLLFQRPN